MALITKLGRLIWSSVDICIANCWLYWCANFGRQKLVCFAFILYSKQCWYILYFQIFLLILRDECACVKKIWSAIYLVVVWPHAKGYCWPPELFWSLSESQQTAWHDFFLLAEVRRPLGLLITSDSSVVYTVNEMCQSQLAECVA